ncbi:inactive leucine-rich repeat receptor-like protein kinase IMK2-like protein [Carex littledalei]|uniref:Inactive leucine-rich repeat receptor-like protein kinase IMK2-like protein n=1 Tax=Carex littledalei TaxID=544730 RepID=A0A833RA84_9POAL|nr:inactive leucine-rich repeat receptor-like protein kinase IMK2-like protein [Carex littledalei]
MANHHQFRKKHKNMNESSRLFFLFLLLLLQLSNVSSQSWDGVVITQADFQGLQAFKQGLVDPFNYLQSWNGTGLDACSGAWTGIKCVLGEVIAIQLPWKGLGGHITEKVGQLTALRKLSLHDNSIGGQIPQSLGFLRDLRGINLFNNRFSGSIPASIGNCVLLQTLDLSNNLLTGSIPSFSNNTKLYRINLSYNNLSGEIPVGLTSLPPLTFLFLNNNNLSGSIPDSWGEANKSYHLNTLYLDHNSLSGSVPASISNLHSLEQLSLNNNGLNGTIPMEVGNLSKLQTLDLSKNFITGDIPATIGNISSLFQLDLSGNNLTGEIPLSFDNLANLTSLNVSYNNLSGPVSPLLSRKFNSSSFAGNIQLCGYSASAPCPLAPSPSVIPSPSTPSEPATRKLNTKELILTIVGISLLFLLLLFCALISFSFKRKSSSDKKGTDSVKKSTAVAGTTAKGGKAGSTTGSDVTSSGDTGGKLVHFDGQLAFTADDLLCATAEIMGKSTYGTVYKATLEDGSQVAVKRLREKITKSQKEFETEVNALGKIRHPNLLALRAYYVGPKGEKLLVFDYLPKGSLAAFLHARAPDTPVDWPTRMKIAIGVARGLLHLHSQASMVHGNLTSANILLDDKSTIKISDYGLSRLMSAAANSNMIATAGALGYRAPELSKLKKANPKTDVYSLGVVILELLTGKSPSDTTNGLDLPQWVASVVEEEWTNEVFDLELMKDAAAGSATGDELVNALKLALHCVDPSPAARPDMQQILKQLEEIKPEVVESSEGPSSTGEPGDADDAGGGE